jgi:hypothetical protein
MARDFLISPVFHWTIHWLGPGTVVEMAISARSFHAHALEQIEGAMLELLDDAATV